MDNSELFELRTKQVHPFTNSKDLVALLDGLIIDGTKIPLVAGHANFNPETEWTVVYLTPKTPSDELTLRNYIEGLRKLGEFEQSHDTNSRGVVVYYGVDAFNKDNQGTCFFKVLLQLSNFLGFNLDLYNDGPNYCTRAQIEESALIKLMKPHIGPNTG